MKIKDGSERLKQVRLIAIKVLYLRRHNTDLPFIQILSESFRFFS